MVGDLVVIDVVDVDAPGALAHLLRDDRGVEVALQHVGRGAKAGVGPSAVYAWQDVERACRAACHRSFMISATVRTTPRVNPLGLVRNQANVCRAPADPRAAPEAAHGEHGARRVASEEIAQGQSVVGKQPGTIGRALLDDRHLLAGSRSRLDPGHGRTSERPEPCSTVPCRIPS